MAKVNISVRGNVVAVKYAAGGKFYEHEWEDCRDLTQKFLARLSKIFDKLNKCNKNGINCLFRSPIKVGDSESDPHLKPILFELRRKGGKSTTYRIILASLRVLEWTERINLKVKRESEK
jgi:hypothetical protein